MRVDAAVGANPASPALLPLLSAVNLFVSSKTAPACRSTKCDQAAKLRRHARPRAPSVAQPLRLATRCHVRKVSLTPESLMREADAALYIAGAPQTWPGPCGITRWSVTMKILLAVDGRRIRKLRWTRSRDGRGSPRARFGCYPSFNRTPRQRQKSWRGPRSRSIRLQQTFNPRAPHRPRGRCSEDDRHIHRNGCARGRCLRPRLSMRPTNGERTSSWSARTGEQESCGGCLGASRTQSWATRLARSRSLRRRESAATTTS